MSTYSNGFTVPTLSLTGSRTKKQYNSVVPTRDYSHLQSNVNLNNQDGASLESKPQQSISNNPYSQPEKYRRPNIFPPKAANTSKNHVSAQGHFEHSSKDLNKNVYLECGEEFKGGE